VESIIENILKHELKPVNFKKHRRVWRRHHTDVVHVIGLQKSSWGKQYYINLAKKISKRLGAFLVPLLRTAP
jgi:hypothetical protein